MNKNLKIVLTIAFAAIILILTYLVYESISRPVRFNDEKDMRREAVIRNLKDIREIQKYFKQNKGSYANDFETLFNFAEEGKIPIVRILPDPTDTTNTRTIKDTIDYISVKDSLFGRRINFNIANLAIVPFSDNEKFEMQSDTLERNGMKVFVFEARVLNVVFLSQGMEQYHQELVNLNNSLEQLNKYPGLKVGSLTEVSTDGNWE